MEMASPPLSRAARMAAHRAELSAIFPGMIPASPAMKRNPDLWADEPVPDPFLTAWKGEKLADPPAMTPVAPAEATRDDRLRINIPAPKAMARAEPEIGDVFLNVTDDFVEDPFSLRPEPDPMLVEMGNEFDRLLGIEPNPEPRPAPVAVSKREDPEDDLPSLKF